MGYKLGITQFLGLQSLEWYAWVVTNAIHADSLLNKIVILLSVI